MKDKNSWIDFDFIEEDTSEKNAGENNDVDANLTMNKNISTIFSFDRFQIMMLISSRRTNVEMKVESIAIKSRDADDDFVDEFVEFD